MARWITLCLVAIAFTVGCKKESGSSSSGEGGTLNVYIWSEYLPDSVVKKFEDKHGIKLQIDLYDSNEAVYEKLNSGVADYDIVVPSDYMVTT